MSESIMRMAIRAGREGMRAGVGGPFGAVVTLGGSVVGIGSNEVLSTNDPTAHAEVVAIRDAARRLGRFHLEDCELYTSCEPCPMCLGAAYWARIGSIFYGATRDDAARAGFGDASIYAQLSLPVSGRDIKMRSLLADEARELLLEWAKLEDRRLY